MGGCVYEDDCMIRRQLALLSISQKAEQIKKRNERATAREEGLRSPFTGI